MKIAQGMQLLTSNKDKKNLSTSRKYSLYKIYTQKSKQRNRNIIITFNIIYII